MYLYMVASGVFTHRPINGIIARSVRVHLRQCHHCKSIQFVWCLYVVASSTYINFGIIICSTSIRSIIAINYTILSHNVGRQTIHAISWSAWKCNQFQILAFRLHHIGVCAFFSHFVLIECLCEAIIFTLIALNQNRVP